MILASKSPRRKEILENIGFNLEVISVEIEEISNKTTNIDKIKDISYKKTFAVAQKYKDKYVVGADTIVELDGKIIGKPKDEKDAFRILKSLSGSSHNVITAFTLLNIEKNIKIIDYSITKVFFKELDAEMIKWYIDTKQPLDKAGAYGIQDKGAVFVEKIEGDFFTVMGFPIEKFISCLNGLNIKLNEIEKI